MNLLQKINKVQESIKYIQKDKAVSTGGGSYKAVTHDVVTAMVRPAMIEQGIVCIPCLIESESKPKEEGAKQFRYEATYDFKFVNIDDACDFQTIRIQAHAMDNADKAPGKALSYAKKYAVLKLFEIESGEDEESRFSDDTGLDASTAADFITTLKEAADMDELRAIFAKAFNAANDAKDKAWAKKFTSTKDDRKAELAKGAKNG